MKKITIAALTTLMLGVTQADYTLKIPLEQAQGGALPKGSITITNKIQSEEWLAISPTYTEWTDVGQPYDCTNWSPDPNTVATGESFTQTATDCKQDQTRSRQDREQETTTLAIRNSGTAVTETQIITVSSTKIETGTGSECRYELDVYQWTTEGNVNTHTWPPFIMDAGANTYINIGGYNYYRGPHVSGNLYQICREPI